MTRYFAMWTDSSVRAGEADTGWCEELVKSGCICLRCCHLLPDIKLEKVILRRRPGNYALISAGGAVTASFLKSVGSPAGVGFLDSARIAISIGGRIVRGDLLALLGADPPARPARATGRRGCRRDRPDIFSWRRRGSRIFVYFGGLRTRSRWNGVGHEWSVFCLRARSLLSIAAAT